MAVGAMPDRTEDAVRPPGESRAGRDPRSPLSPTARFSVAVGLLATGLGAAASLLAPEGTARAVVWGLVAALVAGGAGLWYGLAPMRGRLSHGRLSHGRPRGPRRR
ncbi:hypothetical protein GCM10009801_40450 [Streptomyces albiaxialis]|uniref:Uncharacterized protein n=1 Tax=Streptomyces albiaxialis TaxID=329523 RepID=A0ABP5HLR6_9ACTN